MPAHLSLNPPPPPKILERWRGQCTMSDLHHQGPCTRPGDARMARGTCTWPSGRARGPRDARGTRTWPKGCAQGPGDVHMANGMRTGAGGRTHRHSYASGSHASGGYVSGCHVFCKRHASRTHVSGSYASESHVSRKRHASRSHVSGRNYRGRGRITSYLARLHGPWLDDRGPHMIEGALAGVQGP